MLYIPEIFLSCMACILLLVGVFSKNPRVVFYGTQSTIILTLTLLACCTILCPVPSDALALFAVILKSGILILVFFVVAYAFDYHVQRHIANNEFLVLILLSTVGMMLLVSARDLLMVFLSVELLSLPTYAMVAMRRDKQRCLEAAMKYFIMGALATAVLLYGFSMLFGAAHSVNLEAISQVLHTSDTTPAAIVMLGLVFTVMGLLFKLGAAPWHMWVPDVYDGAPTSIGLFIATVPKIAALGMAIRVLIEGLPALSATWQPLIITAAILSMAIGNVGAIVQTSIKRLFAYSAIAHAGYGLLGLACATPRGYAATLFYTITYTVMTLGAWGILVLMHRAGFEVENISDLKALNNRHPWLALMMLIFVFSLAGVPPLVGFIAKVGLLQALISADQLWLAVLAIIFSVIGVYYYLRIIKVMYFERIDVQAPLDRLLISTGSLVALSINGVLVLLLGIIPGELFRVCRTAFAFL